VSVAHGLDENPFSRTTRPTAYVPRPESEQVLEGLQARVVAGDAALSRIAGPAGMGKSLLLRVLADRTAEQLSSVLVPNPCAGPEDLARQVLDAMHDPSQSAPQLRLVEVAKQLSDSGGLLLLVDNAERLAPEALAALEDWHQRSEGCLRSVCATLVPIAERSTANAADEFALLQPLELAESTALVEAAMERAGLHGPTRARFNNATMMQLQDRARGIPGRLLDDAARLLSELELAAENSADAPAPTQRTLAQLEFELAAQPEPPPATRPEPRAAPDPARVGATAAPPSFEGIDEPRPESPPERLPEIEPVALVDAPPPPTPVTRPAPAARSRAPWLAAAAGFALVVAFGLALRPAEHDADAPRVAANAEADPPPPVAAPPAPEPPLAAEPAPLADPGIGSIEFQARVPAAPEPEVVAALPPPLVVTPETPKPPPAAAEPAPSPVTDLEVVDGELQPGEWLAASFRRLGLPGDLAAQIAREVGGAYDFRHSQAGDHFRVTRTRSGELVAFDYEIAAGDVLELRVEDGRTRVRRTGALASSRATPRD
jgi:type II secretory pathway predicted ATPase ExeA